MPGKLYVVGTPIGNLKDITLRALETLCSVDLIACEDTRRTRKLLAHHNISKPLVSYFEHNQLQRGPQLIERLQRGEHIALVTDAGTPGISDPGWHLVKLAHAARIPVVSIPGPSSLTAALSVSGVAGDEFFFAGFLPREPLRLKRRLCELYALRTTIVLFSPPHRIRKTIQAIDEAWGFDAELVLCRELTKLFEEVVRGSVKELLNHESVRRPRGEYVIIIPKGRRP